MTGVPIPTPPATLLRDVYEIDIPQDGYWRSVVLGALAAVARPRNWDTSRTDADRIAAAETGSEIVDSFREGGAVIGEIKAVAGLATPTKHLACDGAQYARTAYPELYAALAGTVFIVDADTFAVPSLSTRTIVGTKAGAAGFTVPGLVGGTATHTLTAAEMPVHTHVQNAHSHQQYGLNVYPIATGSVSARLQDDVTLSPTSSTTAVNQSTGGGAAHNNMQPYIVMRYVIRASK